jgi:SAM-dependent methyltransferase
MGSPKPAERLKERLYADREHPYQTFERLIRGSLTPEAALLDAGCGRGADTLLRLAPLVRTAVGIDRVDFSGPARASNVHVCRNDLCRIALCDASMDVVVARSVMEHLETPDIAYREVARVLKPGGRFIFLTPQLWDYASVIAKLVPNRYHPALVRKVEGRDEEDTFPVYYRSNTIGAIRRLADRHGFRVETARHLNQYPCYLMFSPLLFLLGTAYERITSRWGALRGLRGWLLVSLEKV